MKKLSLNNIKKELSDYTKVIVTGPPRSGTTITTLIISKELGYKFVDETLYDGGDQHKFGLLIHHPRKMVIQNTSFTKDIHNIFFSQKTCIVLVKRKLNEIIESMDNTMKFDVKDSVVVGENGMFNSFDYDSRKLIMNHFVKEENNHDCNLLPKIIYDHFYNNLNRDNVDYFYVKYEDLKDHSLFIKKEDRRKNFIHLKQVNFDPSYLDKKKGVIIL